MKQFFKFLLASILGVLVSMVIVVLIFAGIIAGVASSAGDDTDGAKENSILEIKLNYAIPERTSNSLFDQFSSMDGTKAIGLRETLKSIRYAETDDKIKGIYLHLSYSPNSYAVLEEIRDALIAFKKSGKFVIAYGEAVEEHSYYIASVADRVYLHPTGDMLFNGFSYTSVYMKGLLDKLGVQAQLIRHGKFKAAGEPLIADRMSDENREQIKSFTGSIYRHYISQIASSRKKSYEEVLDISDKLLIQSAGDAKSLGMIDDLKYEDEIITELKKKTSTEEKKDLELISLAKYARMAKDKNPTSKTKIAVVYANGEITSGESDDDMMGSETIVEALRKAAKDSSTKAIVLRVNSPGGSALASDVIWREVILAKKSKPVIVSMGSLAASGGYYIAAPADHIFAEPNTITGSIGVFGLLVNAGKLLNDKLGVKLERVNFGEYADLGAADRPLTAAETAIVQRMIDRIYDDFITKVAEGRKLDKAAVDSIAQGRVWSGEDALKLGLVDEIGGLNKAIEYAAAKAGVTEYRISSLPEQKEPVEEILKSFSSQAGTFFAKQYLGTEYEHYMNVKKALRHQGIQARMIWAGEIE